MIVVDYAFKSDAATSTEGTQFADIPPLYSNLLGNIIS
jgi:hypothetical protein